MNGFNFSEASDIKLGGSTITALYYGSTKLWPTVIDYSREYLTIESLADNNKISIRKSPSAETKTIYWSSDKKTWHSASSDPGTTFKTLSKNEKIYIKGSNYTYASDEDLYNYFNLTAECNISGNIMSLLYGDNFIGQTKLMDSNYTFYCIFLFSNVVDASNLILPATTLTSYCYSKMFTSCRSLTKAPELPATTLKNYCYSNMFNGCTSLTTAPELPATTLKFGCYSNMFYGCTSLNYIKMLATDISAAYCLQNWVSNVAATGTFVKEYNLKSIPINSTSGIPVGWTIEEVNVDYSQEYFTIESLADNNTIRFSKKGSADTKIIYWSSDKTTWNSVSTEDSDTTLKILSNNEKIYIKGSNNNYASSSSLYNYFNSDAEFNISGNIMSLIYGDNFIGQTTLPSDNYIFSSIFRSSKVVDASNLILSATTLSNNCYAYMFNGCTSLTTTPELPATTLVTSCYSNMFYGCTSLTSAPELPATALTNNCYIMMFRGCTSLMSAPELPATTLVTACYSNMFNGCTSLTVTPELPATTLASSCYSSMFRGCTSLTSAQKLPATTLASSCYNQMFYGCTSLTSAPELPATTLASSCYSSMFNGCRSLSYIKCLATDISATGSHGSWVSNVAATGTFVKPSSMTSWTTGVSGIPKGWTVENI